jgi:CheY-like chemotaxis protein
MLFFSEGKIINASLGEKMKGKKAFFRMMNWKDIPFEMFELIRDIDTKETNISMDTKELILEGTRHVDEMSRLEGKLPLYYKLKPNDSGSSDLNEQEKEILKIIDTGDFVKRVLDKSPSDDLVIYQGLVSLTEKKLLSFLQIKVLIIDDNKFFAGIINDVMEKLFKNLFTTIVVDDGEKGINVVEGSSKPDLVISDLLMEGKDGFDVINSANKYDIPIIILTSERRNKDTIMEMGAGYLHKSVLGTDEFAEVFKKAIFETLTSD